MSNRFHAKTLTALLAFSVATFGSRDVVAQNALAVVGSQTPPSKPSSYMVSPVHKTGMSKRPVRRHRGQRHQTPPRRSAPPRPKITHPPLGQNKAAPSVKAASGPVPAAAPVQNNAGASQPVAGRLPSHWQATVLDHPSTTPPIPLPPLPTPGALSQEGNGILSAPSQGNGAVKNMPQREVATMQSSRDRVLLPIPSAMGIAAYRSGMNLFIVLDDSQPLDTSALHGDGIFANMVVQNVPNATIIRLQLPDTRRLFLSHQAEGWVLGDQPPPGNYYGDRNMMTPREFNGGLLYPMRRPGRVLSIRDPISGQRLLIGTTDLDEGGLMDFRQGDGYDIWPSSEGVVVAVHSQEIGMRGTSYGPLLFSNLGHLTDIYKGLYANKVDQQWLGLQKLPLVGLQKRYYDAFIAAVDSTPGQRFAKRFEEAKAAFSAGAFIEARGILTIALEDDPEEGLKPDVGFLLAVTELLSGRTDDASVLDSLWPEDVRRATQLWRALYLMRKGGHEQESAHMLAQDFMRVRNYPDPVRQVIEPWAAERIARYGQPADFAAIDNLPNGDAYRLARAFVLLRKDRRVQAVRMFASLVNSRDPIVAEKAYEQKTLLDMSDKALTPLTAANKFASLIPDARLAGREVTVRLLQANAYMRAKKWGEALAALDLAQESPEHGSEPMLGVMLFQTLAEIAHGTGGSGSKESTIKNAAMLRGHLTAIPQGTMKGEILVAYGRMLLDLGLSGEARNAFGEALPMLEKRHEMAVLANVGLANTYVADNNFAQANAVLDQVESQEMSPSMHNLVNRMRARIDYKSGHPAAALNLLRNDMSEDSLDLRARLHESRGEWKRAVAAVKRMVETTIPPHGPLDSSKQLLALRLASDASSANDRETLLWLAQLIGTRETDSQSSKVFQLLTKNALGVPKAR